MARVLATLALVAILATPAQAVRNVPDRQTPREILIERTLDRDRWARNDQAVRLSIMVGRYIAEKRYGWTDGEWQCLYRLWSMESGWRWWADGPSSAYGIPQALPGYKMASAGQDWATNPVTQIRWGTRYIEERYGGPFGTGCSPPY